MFLKVDNLKHPQIVKFIIQKSHKINSSKIIAHLFQKVYFVKQERKKMSEVNKEMTGYPSVDRPWLKYYSEEAINAPLPECSIYEYMYENNKDYPKDIAIIYYGRKISYAELFSNIDQTAKAFQAIGVQEEEIVTVALPSIPEALYVVYALNKIGAVANMIHPLAGKNEIINYLNEVSSKVAIVFDKTVEILNEEISKTMVKHAIVVSAGDSLPFGLKQAYMLKNKTVVCNGIYSKWKTFIKGGEKTELKPCKKECTSMAIISHTGGTTGEPKGVMCSDTSIVAEIWQNDCNLPHGRQERHLPVIPPFHNYSLINSMLEPLSYGFTVILIPKYEPDKFADYVKKYRPNHISSIPTYWEALLKNEKMRNIDLSCLKYVYYGGEMMNPETEEEINKLLLSRGANKRLGKGVGSTEMTSVATATYEECNVTGSVGIPLVRVNCKIVEPNTINELAYEQEGEICFSGPTMMLGYYKHQEATNEIIKIHPDGEKWLHTGDLGHINKDGMLFVSGRIKRILITRDANGQGTKMFPDRIEKILYMHPSVEHCCVVGVPDEERVNYPKAFVVIKNKTPSIREELMDLCNKNLPEYMVPVTIEFLDSIPRTTPGKVDYRALEKIVKEGKKHE